MRATIALPTALDRSPLAVRAAPFLQGVKYLAAAGGNMVDARTAMEASGADHLVKIAKSSVYPGRTDGSTWGSAVAELQPAAAAFAELVRSRTVLGRLPGFRRVPFNVKAPVQTAGTTLGWTAQGAPVQASAIGLTTLSLEHAKVAGIVVVTRELARLSDPDAQALIDADLTKSAAQFLDEAFLDPTRAAAGDAPASITYGAPSVSSTGSDEAALKFDVAALVAALEDAGSNLENVALVMSARRAVAISGMECGRDLTVRGGQLLGLPVEIAPAAAVRDAGSSPLTERIVAVDPTRIMLADGDVEVKVTQEGTLELETAPDSPATASTELVSLWQHGLVAIMVQRYIRWEAVGGGAAAYISGAEYAAA